MDTDLPNDFELVVIGTGNKNTYETVKIHNNYVPF